MYVQRLKKKVKDKTYHSVLLRENYRENGKILHRTIANLSKWSEEAIAGLEAGIKGKTITSVDELDFSQGSSFGAIAVVDMIAKKLGITKALGNSMNRKLALFQIAGRLICHGSRNYMATEWSKLQEIGSVFGDLQLDNRKLYDNLDWLAKHQRKIEKKILNYRKNSFDSIYLYDVTSSYFEGQKNELASYGYNRDKKKGKKQIVIGLMTDSDGYPVTVEVFKGNTSDTTTVSSQLSKLCEDFGVKRVVFVGDKGMIKTTQVNEIEGDFNWGYITTITKSQIKSLLKTGFIQLSFFDEDLYDIQHADGTRYVLRRNPRRKTELRIARQKKISSCLLKIEKINEYLEAHDRAKTKIALRKINEFIKKLKLSKVCKIKCSKRVIELVVNETKLKEVEELDGCYVMKTNVPKEELAASKVHDRYKSLSLVESAFRTIKTTLEEIRPIYVRKESRTRGHVFVCSLAYMIAKFIRDKTKHLEYSTEFIFNSLNNIQTMSYKWKGEKIKILPSEYTFEQQQILDSLELRLTM